MSRRKGGLQGAAALGAIQQTSEECGLSCMRLSSWPRTAKLKLSVHLLPYVLVDNAFVLASIEGSLVTDRTFIEDIGQQQPERHPAEGPCKMGFSRPAVPRFGLIAPSSDFLQRRCQGGSLSGNAIDLAHLLGFFGTHHQAAALGVHVVTQHRPAADPFTLAPRRRQLIAGPLADDFSLELCERWQNIECQ